MGIVLDPAENPTSLTLPNMAVEATGTETAPSIAPLLLAGYAKAFTIRARTPGAIGKPYTLSVTRLRLNMTYEVSPSLLAHVEHDTEVRAGNYLHTEVAREERRAPRRQYWSEGSTFFDQSRRAYYGSQRVYRAYVKLAVDALDMTMGRQRIPLGTGRLWSALDMLNPANPGQIERGEYIGVDAALLEYRLDSLSKVTAINAPDPAGVSDRRIAQYRTNVHGTDLALTFGKYSEGRLAGVDVATQLGDAGLRGEWTYTRPQSGPAYRKSVLGFDYVFASSLSVSIEAYHNGQSERDIAARFSRMPLLAYMQPAGKRYLGLVIGYDITPLLTVAANILSNRVDHSAVVAPTVSYSITENTNVVGGAQFSSGSKESEYGRSSELYFIQFKCYF